MFRIEYISKNGKITLGGGNNPLMNVTAISGFELPPRDYATVEFAGENGTTLTGKKDMARTMTISGILKGGQRQIEHACKVLYEPGDLYCTFGRQERKIACRCTVLEDFVRYGKSGLNQFAIQLVADYPYYRDFKDTETSLYSLKNLVTTTFTLPCVFTTRLSEADIVNKGDKEVYPTLIIENMGAAGSSGGLEIQNTTTGAVIKLDYNTLNGEVITVDLARRRVSSSAGGYITNTISNDTDLSKFYLTVGDNHLVFVNKDPGQKVNAKAVFSPEYLTAVR